MSKSPSGQLWMVGEGLQAAGATAVGRCGNLTWLGLSAAKFFNRKQSHKVGTPERASVVQQEEVCAWARSALEAMAPGGRDCHSRRGDPRTTFPHPRRTAPLTPGDQNPHHSPQGDGTIPLTEARGTHTTHPRGPGNHTTHPRGDPEDHHHSPRLRPRGPHSPRKGQGPPHPRGDRRHTTHPRRDWDLHSPQKTQAPTHPGTQEAIPPTPQRTQEPTPSS